jgi:hypothetical protein
MNGYGVYYLYAAILILEYLMYMAAGRTFAAFCYADLLLFKLADFAALCMPEREASKIS